MHVLLSFCFILIFTASAYGQSRMRTIRNKIKEKVETLDKAVELEKQKAAERKAEIIISDNYSKEQFLNDYKHEDDDEIPWNATITVYDGRFLDFIPEFELVSESTQSEPRQLYRDYPLKGDQFIDPYVGEPVFLKARFSYGYSSADSTSLYDVEFLAAYELFVLNVKHQMLRFSTDDEYINFDFTSLSPGVLLSLPDHQSFAMIYAGLGLFTIDSKDERDASSKIDRTFSGINVGVATSIFFYDKLSFDARLDFTAVRYDRDEESNYFMNFLLTEFSLGYVYDRYGLQVGMKYQEFRDIDIDNPQKTFLLKQPFVAFHTYF
jgi:hypothetical protein